MEVIEESELWDSGVYHMQWRVGVKGKKKEGENEAETVCQIDPLFGHLPL